MLFSQEESYYNQEVKSKIEKLDFMIGEWKGEGWIMDSKTREKQNFEQAESIQYGLDGTIIQIQGKGLSDGRIVHDALAIIHPNEEGDYFFTSFLGDGRSGKYEAVHEGEKIIWTIPTPQGEVRYTITIADGKWNEKGDFGMNGQWYPFFEMNFKQTIKWKIVQRIIKNYMKKLKGEFSSNNMQKPM